MYKLFEFVGKGASAFSPVSGSLNQESLMHDES